VAKDVATKEKMKKIIIILGTILLAVWIVAHIIMGNTGLKGSADTIRERSTKAIEEMNP